MKTISLIFAFFISLHGSSQLEHNIHFTQNDFPYGKINNESFAGKIRKKYHALGEKNEVIEGYIANLIKNKEALFRSNLEYDNWPEANTYLRKIFYALYKTEIGSNDVTIRLVRDPEINAFAQEDGTIYINVGMLVMAETEAELASILGHEWGHVTLNHNFSAYKAYIRYRQANSVGNVAIGFGSLIAGLIVRKVSENKYEDDLIATEIQADSNAIASCKRSEFDAKAGVIVEKHFLREEEKEKQTVNYSKPKRYIQSHPTTKKRIAFFENATATDSIKKQNFLVDSVYFFKLKQQAIDEAIYLFFMQHEFTECIELSYTQYLDHPKDKFYLFFLIESIRRLSAIDKGIGDKNFIAANYVLPPKKDIAKPQAIISGKYKINTIGDFVYKNTIFYHLNELLFIDRPQDLANKQLINNDTLEFITYNDAYTFFKKEAAAAKCYNCLLGEQLVINSDFEPDTLPANNLEDYYYKFPATFKAYIENKDGTPRNNLVVLQNFYNYSAYDFSAGSGGGEKTFIKNFESVCRDQYKGKYETTVNLNFKEFNTISDYYYSADKSLPGHNERSLYIGSASKPYDCKTVFPEMTEILQKHNYNKVFYVTAANYDYGTYSENICVVTMIDFKNNKISKKGVKMGAFSTSSAHEKAFEIMEELSAAK